MQNSIEDIVMAKVAQLVLANESDAVSGNSTQNVDVSILDNQG
jgi:hypothetical protein